MCARGRQQIGLQPNGMENLIRWEGFRQAGIRGGMGMDGGNASPDLTGKTHIRMAIPQPRLPDREIRR